MMTSLPCCSAGTNGIGGAGMTLAIVDSSSGAASAAAMNPAIVSAVAGSISIPPTIVPTSCSRNRNRVATPKLPPPPRIAQNRSGCVSASTRRSSPVGGHDLGGQQVVDRQAVLADEIADAAAERDARRSRPSRCRRTRSPGRARRPRSCTRPAVRPGSAHAVRPSTSMSSAVHVAQVEDDPAVGRRVAGGAVAAAADGQLEAAARPRAGRRARRRRRPPARRPRPGGHRPRRTSCRGPRRSPRPRADRCRAPTRAARPGREFVVLVLIEVSRRPVSRR